MNSGVADFHGEEEEGNLDDAKKKGGSLSVPLLSQHIERARERERRRGGDGELQADSIPSGCGA
jgi:hypothetical protein